MSNCYGYARVSTQWQVQDDANSLAAQQKLLPEIAAEKFPGHVFKGLAWDSELASCLYFSSRKGGGSVNNAVQPGDAVVITKADRMLRTLRDYARFNRLYTSLGVTLYIAGRDLYLGAHERNPGKLDPVVAAELKRQFARERTRCVIAYEHSKARFPHKPALGYRLTLDRRLYEDVCFRQMIEWLHDVRRLNDLSLHEVCQFARTQGTYPRTGKEWTPRHVEHAFVAMRRGWPCCEGWQRTEDGSYAPAAKCAAGGLG